MYHLDAGLSDSGELVVQHLHELSLAHSVPANKQNYLHFCDETMETTHTCSLLLKAIETNRECIS
jgi:hypothetical protein